MMEKSEERVSGVVAPQTDSPDGIPEHSIKNATNSQKLVAQDIVPPSPTSDQSLGSYMESDSDNMQDCASTASPLLINERLIPEIDVDEFREQHVADIATSVSMVLSDIVQKNDATPFSSDKLTRFHSRAPPQISIKDYIMRVVKFCKLEKAMLVVSSYLADLFTKSYPNFVLNSLTVHRFLITAFTVAAKGLCDQFCSNTLYARVGGLSAMELNLLEVEFLVRVHYRIVPPVSALALQYVKVQEKRNSPDFQSVASSRTSPTPNTSAKKNSSSLSAKSGPTSSSSTSSQHTHTRSENFFTNKKHPREEGQAPNGSKQPDESEPPEVRSQPKPPGKPSGNKGFKAMKETFKFLQPSSKKKT